MKPAIRLQINAVGNTSEENVKKNKAYCKRRKFKYVKWGIYTHPRCAVVGGGPSAREHFDELRDWDGDVFAINDMAGVLSDEGISCYMYSIDGTPVKFKTGKHVMGAVFSTRVHANQFRLFKHKNIRVFNMAEDDQKDGIEGGATGLCRAPHLFIKMGYAGIDFFGCEGSFFTTSHADADHQDARGNMMIIRAGGMDYLTHAGFMLQCEHMAKVLKDFPKIYRAHCNGLLIAMMDNPDTWGVVAVSDSIKEQHEKQGVKYKDKYDFKNPIWTS